MKTPFCLITLGVAGLLSGCSTIQSWFPDKEKEYQFTAQLAPLSIPADLMHKPKGLAQAAIVTPPVVIKEKVPTEPISYATAQNTRPRTHTDTMPLNRDDITLTLGSDSTSRFTLNVPFERAWRIVGKAISRSGIEVLERSEEAKTIDIQVTQAPTAPAEPSFLAQTLSFFDVFQANETKYIVTFSGDGEQTAVTLLSANLAPLTQTHSVFRLLYDTIQSDLRK